LAVLLRSLARSARVFLTFADALSGWTGRLVGWLTTLLVAVVCFDVATRYLLDFTFVAVQELQWHLFATIFLIGAAYTLRDDRHVRVDVLYANFSPRGRAWVDLLGTVLLLAPFCFIAIQLGWYYTEFSFAAGEGSPQPGGLPARYLLKLMIPVGLTLLLLQGIANALRSLFFLLGRETHPPGTTDHAPMA
jgi:TRAP-type mannitol/chloroaromatic compound transport system permease small subunit